MQIVPIAASIDEELPRLQDCDRWGNLVVWEKGRKRWSIVTLEHLLDYRICYSHWAYLPKDIE